MVLVGNCPLPRIPGAGIPWEPQSHQDQESIHFQAGPTALGTLTSPWSREGKGKRDSPTTHTLYPGRVRRLPDRRVEMTSLVGAAPGRGMVRKRKGPASIAPPSVVIPYLGGMEMEEETEGVHSEQLRWVGGWLVGIVWGARHKGIP